MNEKIVLRIKVRTVVKVAAVGYLTIATMDALSRIVFPHLHELNEKLKKQAEPQP